VYQEVLYIHLSTGKSVLVLYHVPVCLYALVDLSLPLLIALAYHMY